MRFDIPAYWLANVTSIPRRSPGHGWKLDENETNLETYGNHASKIRYGIVNIMQGFVGSKLKNCSLTCESGIFIPTLEVYYQMSRLWWAMLIGKESGREEGGADADFVSSIIIGKIHASRKWKGNFKSFFLHKSFQGNHEVFTSWEKTIMGHIYFRRQITPQAGSYIHESSSPFCKIHVSHVNFGLNHSLV